MDRFQPRDGPHNEPTPLDQKLFEHMGSDAPLRLGPPGFGSMTSRSNDVPSSSRAMQYQGLRVGNQGTSHVPFVPYRAPSYPDGSEDLFAPMSSHMDSRRVAVKRKNPVDGINAGDYYVGSSSSSRFSNTVQPNPAALPEPLLPQMTLSIGPSNWNDQRLVNQEGSQRNVRARNISVEPRPGSTSASSNNHLPLFHSAASAFVSTSAERNQAPFSQQTRTLPSGATGITGRVSLGRPHHPAMQSSSSSVAAAAPTVPGSLDTAIFANGGYAVHRAVQGEAAPSYAHPSSAASSSYRAIPHDAAIPSYPPATSTSIRINQPSPIGAAASSRQARHVSMTHANSARNRMARNSFYGISPLMVEAQRLMMLESHLALYQQTRQAVADPHRDLRLNIDEMSYEELLALEESIGSVNTGLADEKIEGCVKEVVCCSSDEAEDEEDEEDGRCLVCLEGYKDNDLLGILKCGHDFHSGCIKKWLQVKNACPVCKQAAVA